MEQLRNQRGLSQAALGEKSGLGQSSISKIERGLLKLRDREKQDALADALGTTADYLIGKTGDPAPRAGAPAAVEHTPEDDETPLESALFRVMALDPDAYQPRDFDLARATLRATHQFATEGRDDLAVATALLQAAKAVRIEGKPPTPMSVLARWAYGKQDATQRGRAAGRDDALNADARARAREMTGGEPEDFPTLPRPKRKS